MNLIPAILVVVFISSCGANFPGLEILFTWKMSLKAGLIAKAKEFLCYNEIESTFLTDNDYTLNDFDGKQAISLNVHKMSQFFYKRKQAVKNIKKSAENLIKNYSYDEYLELESFDYLNMRDNPDSVSWTPSDVFPGLLNFSRSGVQLPIEVFEGYTEVLNGLKWSSKLDTTFLKNRIDIPDLSWQFFAGNDGFFRLYPAMKWEVNELIPDLFDARTRTWYLHSSVSPRDVVIMMDISGSLHGMPLEIMKLSVKTLLSFLGENDYVNVATFNDKAEWVTCIDKLVPAIYRNKMILFDGIDRVQDTNMTDFSLAFQFGFQALKEFVENKGNHEGSECHKLLVIFTDGGTDYPEEVFKYYSNDSTTNDVRVFTFAVGPHPIPQVIFKGIACNSSGYFTVIHTLGTVRSKMLINYLIVFMLHWNRVISKF